jgi:hypothetical protein
MFRNSLALIWLVGCSRSLEISGGYHYSFKGNVGPMPPVFHAVATPGVCCSVLGGGSTPVDVLPLYHIDTEAEALEPMKEIPIQWEPRPGGFHAVIDVTGHDDWFLATGGSIQESAEVTEAPVPELVPKYDEFTRSLSLGFLPEVTNYYVELSFQWDDRPWTEPNVVARGVVGIAAGRERPQGLESPNDRLPLPPEQPIFVRGRGVNLSGVPSEWSEPIEVELPPFDE